MNYFFVKHKNQIMNIEERLRKQKSAHQEEEFHLLQKVTSMKNQITEVQSIYEERMKEVEASFASTKPIPMYHEASKDMSIPSSSIKHMKSENSFDSNIYPTLPTCASTSTLQQSSPFSLINDVSSQLISNRPKYSDAWLNAGYLGTMTSDCSKASSINPKYKC